MPKSQVVYATLRGGDYANRNFPTILETRKGGSLSYERRVLLKFDTHNTIPAGSTVTSALMTLVVKDASDDATRRLAAYQGTTSWTETQTTWKLRRTNQPWQRAGGDMGTQLDVRNVGNVPGTKVTFDVTSLVKAAVAGRLGSSRYTRVELLDLDEATNESWRAYYTPDDVNVSLRPVLKVTYGSAGSTSTPTPPPPSSSTTSSGSTLRVLEYNVHHNGIGTDGRYSPSRVADWIARTNPDVVSLCEVEKGDSYESGDGVAIYKQLLEQRTGDKWYTLSIQDYGDWSSNGIRNAILARASVVTDHRHEFSIGKDRTVGGLTLSVNGRTINFMSTHFDPDNSSYRTTQAKELVSYATGFAEDRIILGDFNDQPTKTSITKILPYYYDAWAEAKKAGTARSASDNPNGYTRNSRIDYVFYSRSSKHLKLKSVEVVDTRDSHGHMPSDHRPLLAVFSVQ